MTSRLRRKRPTTAPNTPPATTTKPSAGACRATAVGALALVLALSLDLPTVRAGESQRPPTSNSKLKWQVRRTAAERAAEQTTTTENAGDEKASAPPSRAAAGKPAKIAEAPAHVAQHAAIPAPARRATAKTARSRIRDSVMQVSTDKAEPLSDAAEPADEKMDLDTSKSNPLKDPFEDDPLGKSVPDELPSDLPAEDPPALRTDRDPFPEERVPAPTEDLGEMQPDAEGGITPVPYGDSCAEQEGECRKALEELQRKDITKIVVGLVLEGENGQPAVAGRDFPCECQIGVDRVFEGRSWAPVAYTWKATGTCHKPLYFEDVQLERYGHSWNPVVQPFMSAGHFFVSVPLLPYKMGLNPPNECMYTLGYYRPGNCAPYVIDPIPLSLRAAIFQGLGATGFAFYFWPPATGMVVPTALQ